MKDEHGNEWIRGSVCINPGTFGMNDASEENAIANMKAFVQDCDLSDQLNFERTSDLDYGEGRYAFMMIREGFKGRIEVQMPGRELARVRYVDNENQNIWDFPRLYIDGSSWVWKFAILQDKNWPRTCPNCECADSYADDEGWYCCECDEYFTV